jgi:signal transduction histidine kinase
MARRLGVALGVAGLLQVSDIATSAVIAASVRGLQQRVFVDYFTAIEESRRNLLNMVDIESSVRGYALTRDPAMIEYGLLTETRPWEPGNVAGVRELLTGEREPLALLGQAQREAGAWYEQWARPAMERTAAGKNLTEAEIEDGEEQFDRVRTAYAAYFESLRSARDDELRALSVRVDLLVLDVAASAMVSAVTAAVLWWLLRRWVSRPVGTLAQETRRVRSGQLDHAVGAHGPPEIVQLGRDVDAMRDRLVRQIQELTAAGEATARARDKVEQQARELQRSNRDLEQFAYVASHDLQEPLRKVASFCQLLQQRYAGRLDDRADAYIGFAVDGSKRMQQLINDLLTFSRVGRLTVPRTQVDLEQCLRGALRDLAQLSEETGAEVTHDPLPTLPGEKPLLTQLLTNLVSNALKFHGSEPPRVHLSARREGDLWQLSCSDNGIGIEPQYVDRVFVIFQRLHPRDVYEGTGIGLALCKKIVEYHGGQIWIDTEVGEGTMVRWTLPAGDDTPAPRGSVPAGASVGDVEHTSTGNEGTPHHG